MGGLVELVELGRAYRRVATPSHTLLDVNSDVKCSLQRPV